MKGSRRKEIAYRIRTYRHKAYYSLDYGDNIEREKRHHVPSVQEIIKRNMEEERIYAALDQLPAKQRKRVYAHSFRNDSTLSEMWCSDGTVSAGDFSGRRKI